jgi:phenylpropionate dioxygenase-like ring-hydroxylating dioxygenase large terminal subunit
MAGRFPFPRYADGWFQVAYSDELAAGAVLPLRYFGRDLVLFRTESGAAQVLDAYCPHMGAHLGYGGKVIGDCVECPFHAWRFDGQGACATIPYADKIPPRARLRAWPVREINGLIMVWYHAAGAAPTWEVPVVSEYGSDDWTPYERRRWKVRSHNQDMAENAVDRAHFFYVHGMAEMPTTHAEVDGHVLRVLSESKYSTKGGKVEGSVESISHGFGFATTRFKGIVETLLVASVTTIDEEDVDVRFSFMVRKLPHKDVTKTVGRAFIAEIERQLGQDIPIWEHKRYVTPPLLCDGDGPIGLFRKWVKQFYSSAEGSDPSRATTSASSSTIA